VGYERKGKRAQYTTKNTIEMERNEELINKYKRRIDSMQKEIDQYPTHTVMHLIAKVSVYKLVIIDLQK